MIESVPSRGTDVAKYTVADNKMASGSTFGGPRAMVILKATGAIEKMYAPELGVDVFGTLVFHHWDAATGVPLTARPGTFDIYPEHHEHNFTLSNGVRVRETIFVLSSGAQTDDSRDPDPPAAYYKIELTNETESDVRLATFASVRMGGSCEGDSEACYDAKLRGFISNNEKAKAFRIVASECAPESAEVTLDSEKASAASFPGVLNESKTIVDSDPIGILHFEERLRPGASWSNTIVLTFSVESEDDARRTYAHLPDADDAYARTCRFFEETMANVIVLTPDQEVNRGVQWAKANILRVQNCTQQGWCFVNDPTRSNNSVGRDTAWYAMGADYLTSRFTKEALSWYVDHIEPEGMVVEYYDIRNGKTEDYGLNINDDTPLLVIALWHHFCVTGDETFLRAKWPNVKRCAEYILSQRDQRGLVWCSADGTADWGIVGWRNVIQGYRLSGATTEENSECYAALVTAAKIARTVGDAATAQRYDAEAKRLRDAINTHLLDRDRKLYYLNIDLEGRKRSDVTADLVFPVLFGVADHDIAMSVVSRLSSQEFWTDAGLRTVPRNSINYSPTNGNGLFGGVWSGPTFWFSCAASGFNQEFMAYALSASFRHFSSDPLRNNTVPGQFCEWLHGETLTNQGMMLSPWFAPKYVWAALEGAAGLEITAERPKLHPRLPTAWNWIAARNVTVRGQRTAWLGVKTGELRTYATYPFDGVDPENVFDEDASDDVNVTGANAVCVALRREDRTVIFVGNTQETSVNVGVTLRNYRGAARIRHYNTLQNEWSEEAAFEVHDLRNGMQLEISRHGFAIIELHRGA